MKVECVKIAKGREGAALWGKFEGESADEVYTFMQTRGIKPEELDELFMSGDDTKEVDHQEQVDVNFVLITGKEARAYIEQVKAYFIDGEYWMPMSEFERIG